MLGQLGGGWGGGGGRRGGGQLWVLPQLVVAKGAPCVGEDPDITHYRGKGADVSTLTWQACGVGEETEGKSSRVGVSVTPPSLSSLPSNS